MPQYGSKVGHCSIDDFEEHQKWQIVRRMKIQT